VYRGFFKLKNIAKAAQHLRPRHRFNTFPLVKIYTSIIMWKCISSSVIQYCVCIYIYVYKTRVPVVRIYHFYFFLFFFTRQTGVYYIYLLFERACVFLFGFVLCIIWYNDRDSIILMYNAVYTDDSGVPNESNRSFFPSFDLQRSAYRVLHASTVVVRFTDIVLRS